MQRPRRARPWGRLVAAVVVCCLAAVGAAWAIIGPLPSIDSRQEPPAPSTLVFDREDRLLYEVVDPDAGAHRPVPLEEIPLALRQAIVATEDASFYTNPGIDARGIVRALIINIQSGEIRSGASTITQQLARNLLLDEEERTTRSWRRKIREAILAWRLTQALSKDEILALYLNETDFGNMAFGVESAARIYFGKPVSQLNLAECALLAGLPQSPAMYSPFTQIEAAKERQRVVLGLMVEEGYISQARADQAHREALGLAGSAFPIEAPHATMLALEQAGALLEEGALQRGGLRIHTTIDLPLQRAAEDHIRRHLAALNEAGLEGPGHGVRNAAVVALEPDTGAVRVMVGSPDYFDARINGAVNGTLARRQPGSAIKPLTYAAAFERGYAPASMFSDVPTSFTTHEGQPYTPANYDRRFRGPVSLRTALGSSYNVVAVQLLDRIGVPALAEMAQRLGITTFAGADRYGLALTLGGSEVRLVELAAAYGAFANGGLRVSPYLIERIETREGQVLYEAPRRAGERVLDERVAYLVTDVLADPQARAPAFGVQSPLQTTYGAAVKTGTTTEWRDNWTVGYTRDMVVGAWVGNADNAPMEHVSGVSGAAPIWQATMNTAVESLHPASPRPFVRPEGLVEVTVCAESGRLPGPACNHRRSEWFLPDTEPQETCTMHRLVEIDTATGLLAGPDTPAERRLIRRATYWPPEALLWAQESGLPMPPAPAPVTEGQAHPGTPDAIEEGHGPSFAAPAPGSTYCLSADIADRYQQVEVVAVGVPDSSPEVTLLVDDEPWLTWSQAPYRTYWPLSEGDHTLRLMGADAAGRPVEGGTLRLRVLGDCWRHPEAYAQR